MLINTSIVKHKYRYIDQIKNKYGRLRDAKSTDLVEIKAYVGLLYILGTEKSNRQNLNEVWSANGYGIEKCRIVMGQSRFKFLLRCLRFDDLTTRPLRRQTDNLAAVREMFSQFVTNFNRS